MKTTKRNTREKIVKSFKRAKCKHFSCEGKIEFVLDGLRYEDNIDVWFHREDKVFKKVVAKQSFELCPLERA